MKNKKDIMKTNLIGLVLVLFGIAVIVSILMEIKDHDKAPEPDTEVVQTETEALGSTEEDQSESEEQTERESDTARKGIALPNLKGDMTDEEYDDFIWKDAEMPPRWLVYEERDISDHVYVDDYYLKDVMYNNWGSVYNCVHCTTNCTLYDFIKCLLDGEIVRSANYDDRFEIYTEDMMYLFYREPNTNPVLLDYIYVKTIDPERLAEEDVFSQVDAFNMYTVFPRDYYFVKGDNCGCSDGNPCEEDAGCNGDCETPTECLE